MTKPDRNLFKVGVVVGTHGLRGDLKVRTLTSGSQSLSNATAIELRLDEKSLGEFVPTRKSPHKGLILLRLEGYEDINAVADWIGADVFMDLDELPELAEDESYWHELEGLTVVDETLGELGILEDMFTTAAHDIYVVRGRYGEVMIPAVDEFIVAVDTSHDRLLVDLPEGLVEQEER